MQLFRRNKTQQTSSNGGNPNVVAQRSMETSEQTTRTPPTLHISLSVRQQGVETVQKESMMTIRTKVTSLSTREASMLLMVCNVLALQNGLDISLYMSIEWLYSYLTRSGSIPPEEIQNEKVRQTCLLSDLILGNFRGQWIDMEERVRLIDRQVVETILESGWMPDKRTINSWLQVWEPSKWLEFRIVPLELLLERSNNSEPYDSYCRGYGEGSSRKREKTPYSSELDGEKTDDATRAIEVNILEAEAYRKIHIALERRRSQRIQGRNK